MSAKITPYNILRHELIGLGAEVVESSDSAQVGIKGVIVDETQKTITLKIKERKRKVVKENVTLSIHTESGLRALINGSLLLGRPEERIKKKTRISF
ncbi:MAG: ribonuclease P protein subunit [Candidatus Altiarchaeota archaeon]|nr:ribonuclease P protein subunit [Candidatus Altiarchaeota archaeon]